MILHHPDANLLAEYANGTLDWAPSLCVAAHLQLCTECRNRYQQLTALAGWHLEQAKPEALAPDSFARLISRLGSAAPVATRSSALAAASSDASPDPQAAELPATQLPALIQKLLPPSLRWQQSAPGLQTCRLATGQRVYEVALQRIERGGQIYEHDHQGMEMTLVLSGRFSDAEGLYQPGDFVVRLPGDTHRPMATQDQDCLCFTVCAAPVKLTGLVGKLLNPFLRIHPA